RDDRDPRRRRRLVGRGRRAAEVGAVARMDQTGGRRAPARHGRLLRLPGVERPVRLENGSEATMGLTLESDTSARHRARSGMARRPARAARVLGLALLASALLPHPAAAQEVGLPLGSRPEPVVIEDLDGTPVDLADYIGRKPVLLEFWATWCP